ncbi:peptidase [Actinokineospora guangxiensis]|uniref:Peptidase n=1 Tax=Actinokineospora guangxiensis TaxID=1490288 RepID=A0ABW0EGM9_9PSEU
MRLRSLATAVATLSAVVALAPTASAAPTYRPADAAAGWLARQMADGDHFEVDFGGTLYPDAGLTIDAILAFASAKTANGHGAAALTWLAQPATLNGYIGSGGEAYAGATAKAALAAQVRGANPASFGGVDLIARLNTLLTPSGRFSDQSAFGDYSNAFTQSLAVIVLDRTAAGAPASAVDFTANAQCPDGGYPISYGVTPCASDTDATAMVAQALIATGRHTDANEALNWLRSKQQSGGGLAFGDGSGAPNTNTTGLAGQAFRAGGKLVPATKAGLYVLSLRVTCAGAADQRGAIAYDATGFDQSTAPRATAQAILGLPGTPLATLTSAGSSADADTLAC